MAFSLWNAQPTHYHFQIKQSYNAGEHPDIIIKRARPGDIKFPRDCVLMSRASGHPGGVIWLPPQAENWSQERIACAIAHEVGHIIGLADPGATGASCNTIMNKASADCTQCFDNKPLASDKDIANKAANNATRPNCEAQFFTSTGGGGGGGGPGQPACTVHWYQECTWHCEGQCCVWMWRYSVICV